MNLTDSAIYNHSLPVMEHFHTIQGEGYHQGASAYFIRLGGCDVGCFWCDVKESWEAEKHPQISVEDLLTAVQNAMPSGIVVITGGEPLMHDLSELTKRLKASGYYTHVETSGTHPLSGEWDWICLSPKKFKAPQEEIFAKANELKMIIYNHSDFEWAKEMASKTSSSCKLFLQPEWSKSSEMNFKIVEFIKQNPSWSISLQIHKYLQIP